MLACDIGTKAEITKEITASDTALQVGSGSLEVLGTPVMIALMEAASCRCVADFLESGETTVGTCVQVEHLAPTPVGSSITVQAELVECNGRKLTFAVLARDGKNQIGTGTIMRFVVNGSRFMEKAKAESPA